ncbi:MAG: Gfo/Idh/MocA family oxidoreductase [Fimbriimonadales bacterium]
MPNETSRRDFLKASAAVGIGLAAAPAVLAQGRRSASDKIRFATVGFGGKGWSNMANAAKFGEVVAMCDTDVTVRAKGMAEYPKAATFTDYREMLEVMRDRVDAVIVSTPDHTHAIISAMAIRMGKHVYCEKPLTRTVFEARTLAKLAKDHKVATQMGNQGTAQTSLRKVAALIKKGTFGAVKEIHCWTDRAGGWWPQGVSRPESKPTPKTVEWDLWLGPAPERPYADGYHPFAWRGWWDFGSGSLGDIGCHCMNLPFMALDLRDPIAIQATTSGHNRDSYPAWSIVTYEFDKRGDRGPVTLKWYDGGKTPPAELAPGIALKPNGCLIVCEHGTLHSAGEYGGDAVLVSGEALPDIAVEESPGHFAEWVDAIGGKAPAHSNFPNYSGPLTETVVLGNLAVWADGPRLEWDSKAMKVKGSSEYDSLIRPKYRDGWTL